MNMALLLSCLVFCLFNPVFGELIQNFLGDPAEFPATKSCGKQGARLEHETAYGTHVVATLDADRWMPGERHIDRLNQSSQSVVFISSRFNDNGLYALKCGTGKPELFGLVVLPFSTLSVTEGETVKLSGQSYTPAKKNIQCKKDGHLVFELKPDTNNITFGQGFQGRAHVPDNWQTTGDASLTLKGAKMEDGGDYVLYGFDTKGEEKPVAVRLRVNPGQITDATTITAPVSTQDATGGKMGAGAVVAIIEAVLIACVALLALLAFCFGWRMTLRRPNGPPSAPNAPQPPAEPDVQIPLIPTPSHCNGAANGNTMKKQASQENNIAIV